MNCKLTFQKSSFSGSYGCVGVARVRNDIIITNTKLPDETITVSVSDWTAFIQGVKNGEFDHYSEPENG